MQFIYNDLKICFEDREFFFFYTMEVNRDHQLFGYQHSSKYFFVKQNKETYGLERQEVNYNMI